MDHSRRALYNSLRQNWLLDPSLPVEPWQVEDYRHLPLEKLFERLNLQDISIDKVSFLALAEYKDTPEELSDELLKDKDAVDATTQDQVYLLVFELWRRLVPEKACLSIFCDELDHQIYLYDTGQIEHPEALEDVLSNLRIVLEENTDQGVDPIEVFETICAGCANNVESFLYDYIDERIDEGHESYASELLEAFIDYVREVKWFEFLKARLLVDSDPEGCEQLIHELIQEHQKPDLEFNLDILTFMVQVGRPQDFVGLVKKSLPLIKHEEDFQDLLNICADFYHRLDLEKVEQAVQAILKKRVKVPLDQPLKNRDPALDELIKAISGAIT
jgi:hypothetical protein